MLTLSHRTVVYPGRACAALDDVSFALSEGERVALIGANGAGKSTLLKALAAAAQPQADGTPQAAFVPPDDPVELALACRDYVMLGRTPHLSAWRRPAAGDQAAVDAALAAVGGTAFAARRMDALSSGERRRMALALALATGAPILLLDEPTAHLDTTTRRAFYDLLRQSGRTLVMSVHEFPLPSDFFTRVVWLERGRIVAAGEPAAILARYLA